MASIQTRQTQARRTLPRQVLVIFAGRGPFHQLIANRLGNQQCFGILRQQRRRGRSAHHAAALQLGSLRQHREYRRLAAAVTANNRMHRTGRKRRIEPTQHPAGRSIVAKPALRQGGSRPTVHFLEHSASIRAREGFRAVLERRLRHKFGRFVQFRTFFRARYVPGRLQRAQIVLTPAEYSAFCTSDGTPPQHVIGKQQFSASQRSHIRHLAHATALNPVRTRRIFEHRPRLMRSHNNRAAQLTVHAKQRVQKILLGNGIELRRGLVE